MVASSRSTVASMAAISDSSGSGALIGWTITGDKKVDAPLFRMTRCFTQVRWATRCVNVKMWLEPDEIPIVNTSLTYAQLDAALAGATLSVDASELDG